MKFRQFFHRYFTRDGRLSLMVGICLVPALVLTAFGNEQAGMIGVVGLLPATLAGISPRRRQRAAILVYGLVWVAAVWLGYFIKTHLNMVTAAALMAAIGAAAFFVSQRFRWAGVAFTVVVPVISLGLNYEAPKMPLAFTQGILPGSLLAFFVSLCFPEFEAPSGSPASQPPKANRQFPALYAAALATAVGIGYSWDHTGWEVSAVAYSMRPSQQMAKIRSVSRMAAVFIGASLASLLLLANPPPVVPVIVAAMLMVAGAGLHQSKANVTPAFMTFSSLVFMLFPTMDDTLVERKYFERILWVAIGLAVSCFYGLLLPWLRRRIMHRKGSADEERNL